MNGTTKPETSTEAASPNERLVIFPTHHDWVHRDYGLPRTGLRVLTYSPQYKGVDDAMLYRLMDADFVRISTDVMYWMVPSTPDGI